MTVDLSLGDLEFIGAHGVVVARIVFSTPEHPSPRPLRCLLRCSGRKNLSRSKAWPGTVFD